MIMKIQCAHVEDVVNIASGCGNNVAEITEGWTKARQVIHMQKSLSADVKAEIDLRQPSLRYWSNERTPHNAAEEGFTCDACKVGIAFPR